MDWLDYREKLGIGFNDKEKVSFFFTKIFNILNSDTSDQIRTQIDNNEFFDFCNMTGTTMRKTALYGEGYKLTIHIIQEKSTSLENFLAYYVAFLNCQKDADHKKWTRKNYLTLVCNMLEESHLQYEILEDDAGFFIFPKGVAEFDAALISSPLQWLSSYPKAEKAWSKALREYSDCTSEKASDIADLFRKALETFFKEFFGNDQTLEKNKIEYGRYLKCQGVPAEISNNLEALHQAYTHFMNSYAKHHDKTEINVLEYLMYQTGNIIRLLITLKSASEKAE